MALSGKQADIPIAQNDTNMTVTSDSGVESPLGVSNDAPTPKGELNADTYEIPDEVDGAESSSEGIHTPPFTINHE